MRTTASQFLASLAAALLALTHAPALAAWTANPGTNLGVAIAGFSQQQVVSVSDGAGGVILAWSDVRSGLDDDVYVQRVSATGVPLWTTHGVNLTAQPNNQNAPAICSDGAGGAIVTWIDARTYGSTSNDIYAQRINANGVAQWTAGGVALCTQPSEQQYPAICTDGAGGAVAGWTDFRNGAADIYARRINASGVAQGAANGIAICTQSGFQSDVRLVSDAQGGAILTWNDSRSDGGDIYAQRLLSFNFVDPSWPVNGRALAVEVNAQLGPRIAADGAGGAIVAWSDLRGGPTSDVYAQRIQASGVVDPGWPTNGTVVCNALQDQVLKAIVSDGMGGAIFAWADTRLSFNYDIFAHRITGSGAADAAWPANGLAVCTASGTQAEPVMVEDGNHGAFLAWIDARGSIAGDVYAHHVLASGSVDAAWPANGRAVSIAAGGQSELSLLADISGGAIVTWTDDRSGDRDIYAQRIARFGVLGSPEPRIASVRDVPNDQGGRVNVTWHASYLDTDPVPQVAQYWVLRALTYSNKAERVAPPLALEDVTAGALARLGEGSVISTESAGATYFWELVGNLTALHLVSGYGFLAATPGDSTALYNPRTHFMVVAWNTTGTQYWASAPDSGYSADNLPPETPALFSGQFGGGSTALHWIPNTEADFAHYRLYRGTSPAFVPDESNRIASPSDTGYVDAGGVPYYYRLSAVDEHGNESGFALLSPDGTLDAGTLAVPARLSLSRPSPNPARGALTLRFTQPREAHVRLTLIDPSGRVVRRLIDGVLDSAEHRVTWDGRDGHGAAVEGGLYFVRLEAEGESDSARLIWMR